MESLLNRRIAIFDICNTIFASNTTFDFLEFYLKDDKGYRRFVRMIKWTPVKFANAVCFMAFHRDLMRTFAIRFLKGKSKSELKSAATEFYGTYLKSRVHKPVLDLLEKYKARGMTIYLASATLDFLAEMIGEKLDVTGVFSSQLSYRGDVCMGVMHNDWLGCKERNLKAAGIPIEIASVVTDNLSDKKLINCAKEAIVVTKPNRKWQWNGVNSISKFLILE